MTERTTLVQARLPVEDAQRLDDDAHALGLPNRSAAIREGLRLLHRKARQEALARDYDSFYGAGAAPASDISAVGDQVAADSMSHGR